jgi:Rrf2 family protein
VLSKRTGYALRVLLYLASQNGKVVSASDIAGRLGLSIKVLEQILAVLKRSNLVKSERGNRGGYFMARRPEEVSLFEVLPLFEPKNQTVPGSHDAGSKVVAEVWADLGKQISSRLKEIKFSVLCERQRELQSTADYII